MDVASGQIDRCISELASKGFIPSRSLCADGERLVLLCDRRPSAETPFEKSRFAVVQVWRGHAGHVLELRADEWLRITADPPIPCPSNEPPPVVPTPGRAGRRTPERVPWYDVHIFDSSEAPNTRIVSLALYTPIGLADADVDDVIEFDFLLGELDWLGVSIAELTGIDRGVWVLRARAEEVARLERLKREAERVDHLLEDSLPFPPAAPELPLEERPRGSTHTVLYHRRGHCLGNLMWEPPFDPLYEGPLRRSIEALKALGYWVSRFPEGDGLVFDREDYSPETVLADFRSAFPWMTIIEAVRTRTPEDRY